MTNKKPNNEISLILVNSKLPDLSKYIDLIKNMIDMLSDKNGKHVANCYMYVENYEYNIFKSIGNLRITLPVLKEFESKDDQNLRTIKKWHKIIKQNSPNNVHSAYIKDIDRCAKDITSHYSIKNPNHVKLIFGFDVTTNKFYCSVIGAQGTSESIDKLYIDYMNELCEKAAYALHEKTNYIHVGGYVHTIVLDKIPILERLSGVKRMSDYIESRSLKS